MEWDRRLKVPENYLEGLPEAWEPVDSPAHQWFVRFKYMPIFAQLEDAGNTCWYDHDFAFGSNEVRYMFDTALRKVAEVGSYTCAEDAGERGRCAEVYADTFAGTVCEIRVALTVGV